MQFSKQAHWPLIAAIAVLLRLAAPLPADEPSPLPAISLADIVSGRAGIVDLSYPLNEKSNYWPGPQYTPFELKTIATLEKDGVLSKHLSLPEHLGTHLDAPNHFEPYQLDVSRLNPQQLFAPGVVIDVSTRAESDPDYALTAADLQRWEGQHGPIPRGAVVLLNSGWGRYWSQPERFQGRDVRGQLHFPGFSPEAARFLLEQREIRGLGVDTLSIDPGTSKTFEVHHLVNKAGRYGLENVANLDRLPSREFYLVVAPMKVDQGTGGPARIFAILPGGK